jgi:hypothetical protein
MKTAPILFLIFNRPDSTRRVFETIRAAKPSRLYIAADGPRSDRTDDTALCASTRQIVEAVDWNCGVTRLYNDTNLGCKISVSNAITTFFQREESGIVLEDDCLPDPTFFAYCTELLERYRTDERIAHISGFNPVPETEWTSSADYGFWNFGSIWGWASWSRAWKHYDLSMSGWPAYKAANTLAQACSCPEEIRWRESLYETVYQGQINTWDMQWSFARLLHQKLSIVPRRNLIQNIGFNTDATHTHGSDNPFARLTPRSLPDPLQHPESIAADDAFGASYHRYFNPPKKKRRSLTRKFKDRLKRLLGLR